ncbi:hypothetical protein Ae201684_010908 [Aphanomyces euteiches]|uniref:FZ domain-containing protein n=1 Tax=Aphanomyces euteiches TaxID=100861 RepID=A0A6G0WWV2_9STRA|nr:hypothetical protein Ae201684_010908 [Aphanomyces euteiches]KAH9153533.1 hypothetical protein AeRB84_004242 [Aphanomyces euteiches]
MAMRCGAILAILSVWMQRVNAIECENSCGTPEGIGFCKHIGFATCRTDESWEAQDLAAAKAFIDMMNPDNGSVYVDEEGKFLGLSGIIPRANPYLLNESDPCHTIMKRLQCAMHFPVCEIGSDFNRLCAKSCTDSVKKQCPQLTGFCASQSADVYEASAKCFQIDYKGPAVGMWIAGFSISLVFSILNSVGINLQKYSLALPANSNKTSFQQPLWVLGMVFVILGSILDFVAFGMAPQTLLAPLAALSLVWNMFIAPFFHKEKVTRRNLVATGIIFVGVTLTVIFAGHSTPSYDLDDLILLYQTPVMYAYITCVVLFLGTMFFATRYIETNHVYEDGFFHIVCYGGIAGTFGGQSVLLAKSTVELLKSAIWGNGADAFSHPTTYAIIAGLVTCLLSQITFLNGGLKRFDALVVIPVYQSFWILMSVLGGIMYFEEYVSMTSLEKYMFTAGGIITISGIVYLLQDSTVTGGGGASGGTSSGKYVELANLATPSDAWNTDDSDEEQIQTKLDDELDEVVLDGLGSPKNPKTQVSPTDVLFEKPIKLPTNKDDEFI